MVEWEAKGVRRHGAKVQWHLLQVVTGVVADSVRGVALCGARGRHLWTTTGQAGQGRAGTGQALDSQREVKCAWGKAGKVGRVRYAV